MNNTFNMQRFLWLFNKHTKEHYKTYLMSLAVLAGVMTITMGYTGYMGGLKKEVQQGFFAFFLVFSGCIFSSMTFSDLGQNKKALSVLMLPVSSFERFLLNWIYSFIVFQLIFISCFYAVDIVIVKIANSYAEFPDQVMDLTDNSNGFYSVFLLFWFLHSATFLGSIYFEKLHFVKTALAVFGFLFIIVLINQRIAPLVIDAGVSAKLPFSSLSVKEGPSFYAVEAKAPFIPIFMLSVSTLFLWTAAYFKLKEKQV